MERGRLCGEQRGNVDPYFKMPACSSNTLMLARVSKPTYVNILGNVCYSVVTVLMSITRGLDKHIYQVFVKKYYKALKNKSAPLCANLHKMSKGRARYGMIECISQCLKENGRHAQSAAHSTNIY